MLARAAPATSRQLATAAHCRAILPGLNTFAGGTLAYVTGLANVRDTIPFPRTPGNARY